MPRELRMPFHRGRKWRRWGPGRRTGVPPPGMDATRALANRSSSHLRLIKLHVEGDRYEEMGSGSNWFGWGCPTVRGKCRHDPNVSEVICPVFARRIGSVDIWSKEAGCINCSDKLFVVIAEGCSVFFEIPPGIDHSEIQIILCVGLSVGAITVSHRLELLVLFREISASHASHPGLGCDLETVYLIINNRRRLEAGAAKIQIPSSDWRFGIDIHLDCHPIVLRVHNPGDLDPLAEIEICRRGRLR